MGFRPDPFPIEPGQESVWDYPRPPRLEPVQARISVELGGQLVAESTAAFRVLETSHPPAYYLPPRDCRLKLFRVVPGTSFCEWKGVARYETVQVDGEVAERAAWHYPDPSRPFASLVDHRSFYPGLFDCSVDGMAVTPQPGGFYGGWVTPDVVGPFKGEPGTGLW